MPQSLLKGRNIYVSFDQNSHKVLSSRYKKAPPITVWVRVRIWVRVIVSVRVSVTVMVRVSNVLGSG